MIITKGKIVAIGGWALILFATSALGQTVDVKSPTAGSTALTEKGVTADGTHNIVKPTKKGIVPKATPHGGAGNVSPLMGNESGVSPTGSGATSPAARSATATAQKTVLDPENHAGTSLEGRTQPGN
jgi:hypothetical protein